MRVRAADGKVHVFLAIDRVSKFTYVEFHPRLSTMIGAAFLRSVTQSLDRMLAER